MSDNNQKTYDEIRAEIEAELRAQLEDEVRKRKESEEKAYALYDQLQEKSKAFDQLQEVHRDMVKQNRELTGCMISYPGFLNKRRLFNKEENTLMQKGLEYWSPIFDASYYAENNKDVVAEVGTSSEALLKHFISLGTYQSRQGCKDFNVDRYMEFNPDIATKCRWDRRSAYLHYIEYGMKEKRRK